MSAFAELDRATGELDRLLVDVLTSVLSEQATPCRMMTVPEPSGEDVLDAVGELVNIAGGSVKSLFCPHARLSLPSSELLEADGAAVQGIALGAVVLDQLVGLTRSPGVSGPGPAVAAGRRTRGSGR